MTYFLTFACYGCHLHGDDRGSVDRRHNKYANPVLAIDDGSKRAEFGRMKQFPYRMDARRRSIVLKAIQDVCVHRDWHLHAVHVRSNHVHVVVFAAEAPERVMNTFKSWASRSLNEEAIDPPYRNHWARHGSTRWLWNPNEVAAACHLRARRGNVNLRGDGMLAVTAPSRSRLR